jgi:mRNA-degrading endonuclease RelE of RelBE toxin-antitoxin system
VPDRPSHRARSTARAVVQAPRFATSKRRLPPKAQLIVDDEVRRIVENPLVGELKTGALKGVRVVKFKIGPQQLLLAYQFDARRNTLEVLDVGPHENFYRDLEGYLDDR